MYIALFAGLITVTIAAAGCMGFGSGFGPTIDGKGPVQSEARQVGAFNRVELEGSYEVILTQSAGPSGVTLHTNANILPYLKTEIRDGKLVVTSDANIHPTERIKVEIASPDFRAIDIAGAADVHATTPITTEGLSLGLAGAGSYDLEVHATTLKSEISGSGRLALRGTAATHTVDIAGSGDLIADRLETESSKIDVAGSGDAKVFVKSKLDASIAGSGSIHYKGGAKQVHTSVSGSGSVDEMQ
jgi:hypothetical protein